VDGPLSADQYVSLLGRHNIFVAPRRKEGIGMAFLEAMAMGQCVIAAKDATMTEYIVHGENGLLFDPDRAEQIDLDHFGEIGRNSRQSARDGWIKWNSSIPELRGFLTSSNKSSLPRSSVFLSYLQTGLCFDLKSRLTG
jgi:glycosyltransferase involved in cell wall biosynthesis